MNRFDGFQFVLPSLAHLQEINQILDEETERRRTRNRCRRHALKNKYYEFDKVPNPIINRDPAVRKFNQKFLSQLINDKIIL